MFIFIKNSHTIINSETGELVKESTTHLNTVCDALSELVELYGNITIGDMVFEDGGLKFTLNGVSHNLEVTQKPFAISCKMGEETYDIHREEEYTLLLRHVLVPSVNLYCAFRFKEFYIVKYIIGDGRFLSYAVGIDGTIACSHISNGDSVRIEGEFKSSEKPRLVLAGLI